MIKTNIIEFIEQKINEQLKINNNKLLSGDFDLPKKLPTTTPARFYEDQEGTQLLVLCEEARSNGSNDIQYGCTRRPASSYYPIGPIGPPRDRLDNLFKRISDDWR